MSPNIPKIWERPKTYSLFIKPIKSEYRSTKYAIALISDAIVSMSDASVPIKWCQCVN